ncbi:MAG: DNA repair protein RecO [Patescibacteria group bacterium]
MTLRHKTECFVIKKDDRFESDRIFTIFAKDLGRLEIRARAIRKIISKLRGGIEVFSLSDIEFIQGKNYKTLTDAISIEKFKNIKNDSKKLEIINKIADVLNNFINGQEKDSHIWDLLKETFEKLNDCSSSAVYCLIYYYFLWNFFSVLGYSPEVYKCAICQEKLNPCDVYFSYKEGGVVCQKCSGQDNASQKINSDIVKLVRIILKKDWHILSKLRIEKQSLELLKKISDDYYSYFLSSHYYK